MTASTGAEAARSFWDACVRPLLDRVVPAPDVIAGRFGGGSDVLGYDDIVSRDHDWGLRLSLLVPAESVDEVGRLLADGLPESFDGLPVRFAFSGASEARHHVEVESLEAFLQRRLGFDPRRGATVEDWLSLTGQAVLEVVAGPVFADGQGRMAGVRRALARYPEDVRRFVVACDWQRLDEELPFVGRAGQVGDEVGSRVIAARLAGVALHLAFLLERRWPPYAKWLGTAAHDLAAWPALAPHLDAVLSAGAWQERQAALGRLLEALLTAQRTAGMPAPASAIAPFWDRPFLRVHPRLVPGLLEGIRDPAVRALPDLLGSAEQRTDLVPLLTSAVARRRLVAR